MRKTLFIFFVLGLLFPLWGQDVPADPSAYSSEQLDELVAPIALYPDPLVALILPAATVPGDVAIAAHYIEGNGDPAQVDSQPWDDSVRALAHYPDVIKWMDDNLEWTSTLGRAFLLEPTQVMESIQQLRAQARANGTLVSTPQQTVVVDGGSIEIIPAQPDTIYIPQYDPDVVFVEEPVVYSSPVIVFGPPCYVGPWLHFECDWDHFGLWIGTWRPGWDYLHDWRRPRSATNRATFWRADPVRQRAAQHAQPRTFAAPPRPQPMAGAPRAASRPATTGRPATNRFSSRPDTTGWRVDAQGHLAVTPVPAARPTGPQVVLSAPPAANRLAPTPAPQFNRPPPAPSALVNRAVPPVEPVAVHPPTPSPAPVVQNSAPPQHAAPATAPGALFGGYSRGTEAHDFSSRGQASIQATRPSAPPPRAAPTPPPRSAPPPAAAPAPSGGNSEDPRKHP